MSERFSDLNQRFEENYTTGTTTAAYVDVMDWDVRGLGGPKSIVVTNTDSANGLKYKILTRADYADGKSHAEVGETSIAAGADAIWDHSGAGVGLARIKVQVKDGVATSHAGYQVDYIGYID